MRTGAGSTQGGRGRLARIGRTLLVGLGAGGLLLTLAACQPGKQVLVDVLHPPLKVRVPSQVKEVWVEEFQGPVECAKPFKPKLTTKETESEVYKPAVPGLSLPEETLTVKGAVTTCALSMGSGTPNSEVSAWYMGNQIHQEVVNEHTNRPGAPQNEVRDVLVDRVVSRTAKALFPMKRKEIRTFFPVDGDGDIGVSAAAAGNWTAAIESFGKHIKEKPTEHRAWYNRGIAYEVTRQFKAALKDLQKAIELKRRDEYVEALARVGKAMQDEKTIEAITKNAE